MKAEGSLIIYVCDATIGAAAKTSVVEESHVQRQCLRKLWHFEGQLEDAMPMDICLERH